MNKLIGLVLGLALSVSLVACTDEADDLDGLPVSVDPSATLSKVAEADECGIVADTELCAIACDRQALIDTYVQPGTCAVYECHLADGSPINVGGCRQ